MSWLSQVLRHNVFVQQLHFKLSSVRYIINTYQNLQTKRDGGLATTGVFAGVLIDILLGCTVAYCLLCLDHDGLGGALTSYVGAMLESTEEWVTWLMGVPAGLKLNVQLDCFLGTKFLTVIYVGKNLYLQMIQFCSWLIIKTIIFSLLFGFTVGLALLHDFLNFLNLLIICLFVFAAWIFGLQCSVLRSLARLFMGKKWNPLRERVDSCHFDMGRLLFGTILFAILLFLIPTTSMYYFVFVGLRFVQLLVQTPLLFGIVIVNKFAMSVWYGMSATFLHPSVGELRLCLKRSDEGIITDVYGVLGRRAFPMHQLSELVARLPPERSVSSSFEHPMLHWHWVGWQSLWPPYL